MAAVRKIKRKAHWRGEPDKIKHAVREVDGVHQDKAVCGAKPRENWTEPGTRKKKADVHCGKCTSLEPRGMGPGGENYKPKVDKVKVEVAKDSIAA